MKYIKNPLFLGVFMSIMTIGCFDDHDDIILPATNTEIGDFVWKAMNLFYLYQPQVSDLADDRFEYQSDLNNFIADFDSPELLFESPPPILVLLLPPVLLFLSPPLVLLFPPDD